MVTSEELLNFAFGGGVIRRLDALPAAARGTFAASCAQRLLRAGPPSDWVGIAGLAVSTAWAVLQGSDTDAREVLDQLEALDEGLDHDVVAGAYFALKAATTGAVQDAAWASGRAFDAAFAAAVDLDSTTIRTLEGGAASPRVQYEYQAQVRDLETLEHFGYTPHDR